MSYKLVDQFLAKRGVEDILTIFTKKNIDICFVGGCIRDEIIGKKNYDIDFAINCFPQNTISILEKNNIKFKNYAERYGSITAIMYNNKFEITSLREDVNQSGRDTDVKFTKDWYKDALRRDFTMNAIYLTPSGKLYDYFDGREDIAKSQIKFIGNIETRIKEDYLRIFRFYRFLGCFEKINIFNEYENLLVKYISKIKENIKHDIMRIELLKMLKNLFPKNSFSNFKNPMIKNELLVHIDKWWAEDDYSLGINKCMNEVNKYF